MNKILPIILAVVLSGCAAKQTNISGRGYIGNNIISGYDLDDIREARQTIKYSKSLPKGAKIVSKITEPPINPGMVNPNIVINGSKAFRSPWR